MDVYLAKTEAQSEGWRMAIWFLDNIFSGLEKCKVDGRYRVRPEKVSSGAFPSVVWRAK